MRRRPDESRLNAKAPEPRRERVCGVAALCLLVPLFAGCDPGAEAPDEKPRPATPPTGPTSTTTTKTGAPAEEVDLTADRPEAARPKDAPLLASLEAAGPVNATASRCYRLLAEMKTNVEQISADLDAGGKEITRLIRSSDELAKNITDLAGVWLFNEGFRDICGNAKRQALVLNEELSRVPRKWTHVRWSFSASVQSVSKLRLAARDLAEAEPKPVLAVGKDGKPLLDKQGRLIYVDPPPPAINADIAKRDEVRHDVEAKREQIRKLEELKKKPPLQSDLDSK